MLPVTVIENSPTRPTRETAASLNINETTDALGLPHYATWSDWLRANAHGLKLGWAPPLTTPSRPRTPTKPVAEPADNQPESPKTDKPETEAPPPTDPVEALQALIHQGGLCHAGRHPRTPQTAYIQPGTPTRGPRLVCKPCRADSTRARRALAKKTRPQRPPVTPPHNPTQNPHQDKPTTPPTHPTAL